MNGTRLDKINNVASHLMGSIKCRGSSCDGNLDIAFQDALCCKQKTNYIIASVVVIGIMLAYLAVESYYRDVPEMTKKIDIARYILLAILAIFVVGIGIFYFELV